MKIIEVFKNFWLDFFAANYKRLKKNATYETPISIVSHLSFTQAINFNTILVFFLYLVNIKLSFTILFSPIVILFIINCYYFYHKLNSEERNVILGKMPKYNTFVYDLYDVFSTILFMFSLYLFSKS